MTLTGIGLDVKASSRKVRIRTLPASGSLGEDDVRAATAAIDTGLRGVTLNLDSWEDFEFLVIIEVDDLDALRAYLAHPSHAAFGAHFTQSSAAALAYDYEVVDVADAIKLVGG